MWVYVCVGVLSPTLLVCGATWFISTCLQIYKSMPELDLWKIETKIRCNVSSNNYWSVCLLYNTVEKCACISASACVIPWLPDTLKSPCMFVICVDPTPFIPCKDVFSFKHNCMYLFEVLILSYMQICTKKKKTTNSVYLCITYNLAIQHYDRIVSCK